MSPLEQTVYLWLEERGVQIEDIAELTFFLQADFFSDVTMEECIENVQTVLTKREVQNALLTGIQLDLLAEKEILREPLQQMIYSDESLYGIDEVMSLAILNVYGSIGFTNYGYIDRLKPGILCRLNSKSDGKIHTYLDDLVAAVAAAAAARLAHTRAHSSTIIIE
ncbi:phosphatidylglycerophosphatase A [Shimazuella sp. AN120528]|uniref:phosphatidylglycerophosphatase A family protein n=1 Tax=Shimazuella soli TaxID=1892854 RepID=UPI001F0F32D9|nr:phosphatidylglycerophosphatase A [Shimazuella soli]MCH5585709.1 phosphatidylglycerophosphatase A [Shimazuella soli]